MIATTFSVSHHSAPRSRGPLRLSFAAQTAQVAPARRALARFLRDGGWTQDESDAVLLAVGEACNNAVEHAVSASSVSVVCALSAQGASVEVRNKGGEDLSSALPALCVLPEDTWATHGRGFALMSLLMDDVAVCAEDGDTVVRMFKSHSL